MLIQFNLLLDPLSPAQKATLAGQPLILGTGSDLRLMLVVNPDGVTVSQEPPPDIQRYDDGTAFVPATGPRPRTWEIQYDGAHGRIVVAVLEMLSSAMRLQTFNGQSAVTRLWDYSEPAGLLPYTEHTVALLNFEAPQDAIVGDALRYLEGGSITLQEVV